MIWKSTITGVRYEAFDSFDKNGSYMVALSQIDKERVIRLPYDEFVKVFQRESE